MILEFSKANLINKARMQPEKVRQVLDKVKTDGIFPTIDSVLHKLSLPLPLGYCNSGVVIGLGDDVVDFNIGDRVASNGPHSDVVVVPKNLVCRIPDEVSFDEAAFTVIGSVALHGVRLANPSLGEKYVVFGLGIVGLLTVQFLRASGCTVLAIDVNASRLKMAERFGAHTINASIDQNLIASILSWSGGNGGDGVLITASAKGDQIVHQAAQSCRKRGKIILIGVVDLELNRSDFYEKELTFQVSCSYGPGRYDNSYEQHGIDYPEAYVRWTEGRNFSAVLSSIAEGTITVSSLISGIYDLSEAESAYENLNSNKESLGILLKYEDEKEINSHVTLKRLDEHTIESIGQPSKNLSAGIIGVGNFSVSTILPIISKTDHNIKYLCGFSDGTSTVRHSRTFGADIATTDPDLIFNDQTVDTVYVMSRHDSHASYVLRSLHCGKNVFVEKPLCTTEADLEKIRDLYYSISPTQRPHLIVGFNRRFSSHSIKIRNALENRSGPLSMNMTINAGFVDPYHWTQEREHGGRIVGEGCHFIDLMTYLTGSLVKEVYATCTSINDRRQMDNLSIHLSFEDGSLGNINYFSYGAADFPKEKLEIFYDGKTISLNNFKETKAHKVKGFRKHKTRIQDKGHVAEINKFVEMVSSNGQPIITPENIFNVSMASIMAYRSAETGVKIKISLWSFIEFRNEW